MTTTETLETAVKELGKKIVAMDKSLAAFIAGSKSCRDECYRSRDAIFGNGGRGLKSQVTVLTAAFTIQVVLLCSLVAVVATEWFRR